MNMHKAIISAIVAMDEKRGIGKNNKIPWHIPLDLQRLKNLTKKHVVILGRKTYDSMATYYKESGRQMPGKLYVIVTRDSHYNPTFDNANIAPSPEEAMEKHWDQENELFIIGGSQVFS